MRPAQPDVYARDVVYTRLLRPASTANLLTSAFVSAHCIRSYLRVPSRWFRNDSRVRDHSSIRHHDQKIDGAGRPGSSSAHATSARAGRGRQARIFFVDIGTGASTLIVLADRQDAAGRRRPSGRRRRRSSRCSTRSASRPSITRSSRTTTSTTCSASSSCSTPAAWPARRTTTATAPTCSRRARRHRRPARAAPT